MVSVVGIFFFKKNKKEVSKISKFFVSLAVGAFFGDAFIHLLPESYEFFENSLTTSWFVFIGIFTFFGLEKFFHWQHCHADHEKEEHIHPVANLSIFGDAIHNFIDGMLIASAFSADVQVGIATSVAVLLHEIPQEISEFGILIHNGVKPSRAIKLNLLSAVFSFFGAILIFIIGPNFSEISNYILPITAGGFIYIAGSDLLPELKKSESKKDEIFSAFAILLGVFFMAIITLLE